MGKFEDEIKRKLNEGEIKMDPKHWAQLNNKLNAQNKYTPFEKKIKDIFNHSIPIGSTSNWEDMNDRLNQAKPSDFNKKINEILNNQNIPYSNEAWEKMRDHLSNQNLTSFESGVKNKLSNKEAKYNPVHWEDMNNRLNSKKKRPIAWWMWGSVAAAFIIGGIGLSYLDNKTQYHTISKNNSKAIETRETTTNNITNKTSLGTVKKQLSIQEINNEISNNIHTPNLNNFNNNDLINNRIVNANNIKTPEKQQLLINNNSKNIFNSIILKQKTNAFLINLESIVKTPFFQKKPTKPKIHAAATLWLNFWDNPSITGFYGKNHISNQFTNSFETRKSNKTKLGKIDFVQPLQNILGYERRFHKSGFSIGTYYRYLLKKNWNYNEISISTSYNKNILPQLNIRIGASAIFHKEQLAVNKLTLKERSLNSDYIFSSSLNEFQARTEEYMSYNLGGFINHPNFFVGYTAENTYQNFINKTEEKFPIKHTVIGGININILNYLKATAMLKLEKKLINTYSPCIGLTFKNKYVIVGEYNKLSRYDISLGYNWNQKLRVLGTLGVKEINDEREQLNLNDYQERKGHASLGVYYTFN